MSQQIEIEFKNMLTKQEYDQLLVTFQINQEQIHLQANHYFDTQDFQLKNLYSGLRIRQKDNHFECTLKEKSAEHEHIETTDILSEEQAKKMLNGDDWFAPFVKERLDALHIEVAQLHVFGSLATNRVELDYQGGILVLDHSFYLQEEDYEVEYETSDVKLGFDIFQQFLHQHHIELRPANKKIARFMAALIQQQTI